MVFNSFISDNVVNSKYDTSVLIIHKSLLFMLSLSTIFLLPNFAHVSYGKWIIVMHNS